jgi:hypothetical protein
MLVRTPLVELSILAGFAYRQKLRGGQAGVVILRNDCPQPGLALVNHRTGEPDLADNLPQDLFPREAFVQALELTVGLPYRCRGPVQIQSNLSSFVDARENGDDLSSIESSPSGALATVSGKDYAAVVKAYTNRKGELSYELLNKALIKAAHSNPFVATMISQGESLEKIRDHVIMANFEAVSGNHRLSLAEVNCIIELLDEVSPRSVLRELNDELRKMVDKRSD